jgi:hypothetical protein
VLTRIKRERVPTCTEKPKIRGNRRFHRFHR